MQVPRLVDFVRRALGRVAGAAQENESQILVDRSLGKQGRPVSVAGQAGDELFAGRGPAKVIPSQLRPKRMLLGSHKTSTRGCVATSDFSLILSTF